MIPSKHHSPARSALRLGWGALIMTSGACLSGLGGYILAYGILWNVRHPQTWPHVELAGPLLGGLLLLLGLSVMGGGVARLGERRAKRLDNLASGVGLVSALFLLLLLVMFGVPFGLF